MSWTDFSGSDFAPAEMPGANSITGGGSNPFSGVTGGGVASGIGSVFGAIGDFQEAGAYGQAAKLAEQNAVLSAFSGKLKAAQEQRQVNKVTGAQSADYYGAGLDAKSGSAADVIRNTVQQGALEKAVIVGQTTQQMNAYNQEAKQFKAMQSAGIMAGIGNLINGVASVFGL